MLSQYRLTMRNGNQVPTTKTTVEEFPAQSDKSAKMIVASALCISSLRLTPQNFGRGGGLALEAQVGKRWKIVLRAQKPKR